MLAPSHRVPIPPRPVSPGLVMSASSSPVTRCPPSRPERHFGVAPALGSRSLSPEALRVHECTLVATPATLSGIRRPPFCYGPVAAVAFGTMAIGVNPPTAFCLRSRPRSARSLAIAA